MSKVLVTGGTSDDPGELLDALVTTCKLFIDDTFLLAPAGRAFITQQLLPALGRHQAHLFLSNRMYVRLVQRARGAEAEENAASLEAARGVSLVRSLEASGHLERPGEDAEVTGHLASDRDLLLRVAYQHGMEHSLSFFTLDERTAMTLLASNQALAVERAKPLHVAGLSPAGALTAWAAAPHRRHVSGSGRALVRALDVDELAKQSRLFLDTSSLMSQYADEFVRRRLMPVLSPERRLLVPQRVLSELTRHARRRRGVTDPNEEKERRALVGLRLIEELDQRQLVDLRRDSNEVAGNDTFFDALMLRLLAQHQQSTPITLITQDRRLADQVLLNAHNLGAPQTQVGFVNERERPGLAGGALGNWAWRLSLPQAGEGRRPVREGEPAVARSRERVRREDGGDAPRRAQRIEPFAVARDVRKASPQRLGVSRLPSAGDSVFAERSGAVQLTRHLAEGGEGVIYETSAPDTVCKVFFEAGLTTERLAKLTLMVSRPSPSPTICWPRELVYNSAREFVGYLMPRAKGQVFNDTIFKKPLLEEAFPSWGRQELVQLAITTLTTIKKLHDINVILGDINAHNFMVVNEREVYLVDTDSFQVEDFPCPVGVELFTPPELIGKSLAEVLRTPEHEVFAVATLLFMILMPGKPPYAGQGGGSVVENIREHKFPWVTEQGERSAKPFGPYRYIWSHLHRKLKDDFIEIFYEERRTPRPRENEPRFVPRATYLEQFLHHLNQYRSSIQRGRHSNALFPTDIHFFPNEDLLSLPCAEPGCPITTRTKRKWHEESLARGLVTHRCDKHREMQLLRRDMTSAARERAAHRVDSLGVSPRPVAFQRPLSAAPPAPPLASPAPRAAQTIASAPPAASGAASRVQPAPQRAQAASPAVHRRPPAAPSAASSAVARAAGSAVAHPGASRAWLAALLDGALTLFVALLIVVAFALVALVLLTR